MTHWFQRLSARDDLNLVMVVMIIALAALGVAAHWLTQIAGPLTENERVASRVSGARRYLGWLSLVLAVFGWIAIVLLFTSPQEPVTLVLVSRARAERIPSRPDVVLATARGVKCAAPRSALFDVGNTVDKSLAALDRSYAWERAGEHERALARKIVNATTDSAREIDSLDSAQQGILPRPAPPRWLVESIELSLVLRAISERHVEAVYVAPGATQGASSWRILGDVLHARGIKLCLVAPPADPVVDGLVVRRLAYATLDREHRTITAWAVVDGTTPADEHRRTLELWIHAGNAIQAPITIPQDDERSRLVPLCFGACPDTHTEYVYEHVERANEAFLTSANGEASAQIIDGQLLRQRPLLHFEHPNDAITYRVAFDERTMFPEETQSLNVELQSSGVPMPTTKKRTGDSRHAYVREVGSLIIVASSAAAAQRVKFTMVGEGSGPGARTRIVRDELGPRTLNSFAWTAPPQQTSTSARLALDGAYVRSAIGAPNYQELAGIVSIVYDGADTAVVIDAGGRPSLWSKNPFWAIPTLRAIAYAADIVTRPERKELTTTDVDSTSARAAPLVTEADQANAFRAHRRRWDLTCVFAVGLYLFVMWSRRRARAST